MPAQNPRQTQEMPVERSATVIVGAILAVAVIRLHDQQDGLDNQPELSGSRGIDIPKEDACE